MGALKIKSLKKRKLNKLRTIIGSDLLTAREKIAMNEMGGLYSLTDELAYTKGHEDKSSLTVRQFEKRLKENVNEHFCVVYNPTITAKHKVEGHSIYFFIPAWDAYVPVCKVGKSADNEIPANSVGFVAKFEGDTYEYTGMHDEEAVLYRGWVAAEEACKLAFEDWSRNGIEPSRAISVQEAQALKQAYSVNIGGKSAVQDYVQRATEMKLINELAHKETNLNYFKDENNLKFINKENSDKLMFCTKAEYESYNDVEKNEIHKNWKQLSEDEIKEFVEGIVKDSEAIREDLKNQELIKK